MSSIDRIVYSLGLEIQNPESGIKRTEGVEKPSVRQAWPFLVCNPGDPDARPRERGHCRHIRHVAS